MYGNINMEILRSTMKYNSIILYQYKQKNTYLSLYTISYCILRTY
jgi:hypothetical protein